MRFPEFNDKWLQTTLERVAEINPTTKDVLPHKFRYIDLEVVEKGILLKHNIISKDNAPSRAQRLLQEHDVLFQMVRPYQQNNLYYRPVDNVPSVASTGYAQLRSYQSGRFLYYAVHSTTFLDEVLNRCTGTNYPAISVTDLGSIPISFPSLPEQEKIASFLSLLDERIEAQRQTIKERKNQKKALLSQIFSQALRFPGFSDEWQQTTLGEVADIQRGERVTKSDLIENGVYPVVSGGKEPMGYTNKYNQDSFTITIAQYGTAGYIQWQRTPFWANDVCYILKPNSPNLIPVYLYNLTLGKQLDIYRLVNTTAVPAHLPKERLLSLPISLPSLAEQKKIAELFTIFDERIEVEEALLACYERQKRYLLRQMFV